MPIKVYVLIQAKSGKSIELARKISKIPGVISCHPVTGRYSMIAFVEAYDLITLSSFIMTTIGSLDGIEKTETAVILKLFEEKKG